MKTLFPILALFLVGCASAGREIDASALNRVQKSDTKPMVAALLGAPDQVERDTDGSETWQYTYIKARVKGETFIPYAGAFMGGTRINTQHAMVIFGPEGYVTKVTSNFGATETSNLGGGPRRTPGLAPMSESETRVITAPPPAEVAIPESPTLPPGAQAPPQPDYPTYRREETVRHPGWRTAPITYPVRERPTWYLWWR